MARVARGDRGDAATRRRIAEKYLEVGQLAATESGAAVNNVVVGVAVLAGIAASDAICLAARGERSSEPDRVAAVAMLRKVDPALAEELSKLVALKPAAHYGTSFISDDDRTRALRAAGKLVTEARERT